MGIARKMGAIAATGVLACMLFGCSSSETEDPAASTGAAGASTEAPAEQATEEAAPAEDYTVAEEALDTSNPYATYITGTLTNNKNTDVSYVQIEYVLYDADGAQIGTALANTSNLKAGGVWKFEAVAMEEPTNVASYERADITGF